MSKPILVGLDPKRGDLAPLTLGAAIARLTGAPLIALAAYLHDPITNAVAGGMVEEDVRNEALRTLEAQTEGTDADLLVSGGPSPARVLHDTAVRLDAAMIVVGSTTKGPLGRVAPGTTAERLLHGAPCAVVLATTRCGIGASWEPRRVGVGFVDLVDGHAALRAAAALAHDAGGTLHAMTAIEPLEWGESAVIAPYRSDGRLETPRAAAQRALDDALDRLQPEVRASSEVMIARAADALIELSRHVDLLVCGSRGHGPLGSVLLGGVSRRLIHRAACPVIVVPRGRERALEALTGGPAAMETGHA